MNSICWKRSQNFVPAEKQQMKIVVLDGHCLNPGDLDWKGLEKFGSLEVHPRTSPDQLLNRAKGTDVLITNKCILTNDLIDRLPSLKYIGVTATEQCGRSNPLQSQWNYSDQCARYSTPSVTKTYLPIFFTTQPNETHAIPWEGKWKKCPDFCYTLAR